METQQFLPLATIDTILDKAAQANDELLLSSANYVGVRAELRALSRRLKLLNAELAGNDFVALDRMFEKVQIAIVSLDRAIKKVKNREHI